MWMRENDSLILNIEVFNLMIFSLFLNVKHVIGFKYSKIVIVLAKKVLGNSKNSSQTMNSFIDF